MDAQSYASSSVFSDYDDDDDCFMQQVTQEVERFRITGMNMLPPVISGGGDSDDTWEVESYAADSMDLAKLRLTHVKLGYEEMMDDDNSFAASSLGQGSAAVPPRGRSTNVIPDEEDWTISSECNDSIGLMTDHLAEKQQQQNKISKQPLARITRRRASMDNFVHQEQHQEEPQQPPREPKNHPMMSHMSLASVSTVEESVRSGSTSEDPAAANKRGPLPRHKSMPIVKSKAPLSSTVPLWPSGRHTTSRERMSRRVSNDGTPCAA
jgi:hypothetical protein